MKNKAILAIITSFVLSFLSVIFGLPVSYGQATPPTDWTPITTPRFSPTPENTPVSSYGDLTDVYDINIVLTNTNQISINTYYDGTIYYNIGTIFFNPFVMFDPMRVLSSLMIFVMIGVAFKKTLHSVLVWLGLSITGLFNLGSIYWQWTLVLLLASYMFYRLLHGMKKK